MPGISTSRSATSGRVSRAAATTSSPRPTSATTVMSGSRSSRVARAPRTRAWSSASRSRIVTGATPPAAAPTVCAEASPRSARRGRLVQHRRALAATTLSPDPPDGGVSTTTWAPAAAARSRSPDSPFPSRRDRRRTACPAVVDDGDPVVAQGDRAARCGAVPDHVGDALAHRPREQLAQVRSGTSSVLIPAGRRSIPAARSAARARAISAGSTAPAFRRRLRGRRRARRGKDVGCRPFRRGRVGSMSTSRPASSALTVMTVRE